MKSKQKKHNKPSKKIKPKALTLEEEVILLREENAMLKLELAAKYSKLFKSKRERLPHKDELMIPGFDNLLESEFCVEENVEEKPELKEVVKDVKKRKKQRSFSECTKNLPVLETVIDLTEDEKKGLIEIDSDSYDRVAVIPAKYYIQRTIIKKYVIENYPGAGVITADRLKNAVPGSYFAPSFYSEVLVKKFADHLPLYRISEQLERNGLPISRQTLSKMVLKLAEVLKPLTDLLKNTILESQNVFMDETTVKMQQKGSCKQSYFWLLSGSEKNNRQHLADPPLVYYEFHDNRQHVNVNNLLGENYQGNIHSDAYQAYENFAKRPGVTWQVCWAHARRQFFEATTSDPFRTKIVQLIDQLFELERSYWKLFKSGANEVELLQFRTKKSKPLTKTIFAEIKGFIVHGKYLENSKIFKACNYLYSRKDSFCSFLSDHKIRIDNNVSERKIRPLTIGRKNWLFVGSERGGKAAATIYSLIQTCRNLKVNPQEYLDDILERINNTPELEFQSLLPQNWQK